MKKSIKKVLAFAVAVALVFTMGISLPQTTAEVQAATKVYVNPYSVDQVGTYKPASKWNQWTTTISIVGCEKASQIKNLKSSNTSVVKVKACNGYIQVIYGKKAGKVKISCTVKGKKLSTTYTVKKYTNPLSTFKLGSSNFTSKFSKDDEYKQKKAYKNQTLNLKAKSGWKIVRVHVYNGSASKIYTVNKSSFNKKVSLSSSYASLAVTCYNSKTKVSEYITLYKSNY